MIKVDKDSKYFMCEECSLVYIDNNKAKQCEKWCKKHHSCNIAITKYAINKSKLRRK